MPVQTANLVVTWDLLPEDYILPDDPVDNINQPLLANSLTDSLESNGYLPIDALTTTNYGICATFNGKLVVKAPDWAYIPHITTSREEVNRSYTPHLQGGIPLMVMEFLSDSDGNEYSIRPTHPLGKWFFYEQILQVPNYLIFEPKTGELEVYQLNDAKRYQLQTPDAQGRYFIGEMNLYIGKWEGTRENRTGWWLRWWDERGELLLWGLELAQRERQRAEQQKQQNERLIAQLRAAGIEPDICKEM